VKYSPNGLMAHAKNQNIFNRLLLRGHSPMSFPAWISASWAKGEIDSPASYLVSIIQF